MNRYHVTIEVAVRAVWSPKYLPPRKLVSFDRTLLHVDRFIVEAEDAAAAEQKVRAFWDEVTHSPIVRCAVCHLGDDGVLRAEGGLLRGEF